MCLTPWTACQGPLPTGSQPHCPAVLPTCQALPASGILHLLLSLPGGPHGSFHSFPCSSFQSQPRGDTLSKAFEIDPLTLFKITPLPIYSLCSVPLYSVLNVYSARKLTFTKLAFFLIICLPPLVPTLRYKFHLNKDTIYPQCLAHCRWSINKYVTHDSPTQCSNSSF